MLKSLQPYRAVLQNFTALSVLQLLQILVAFLSYPYLIKVLGAEKYGIIAYAQAIVTYLALIVNYGFGATATKDISLHQHQPQQLQQIIGAVFWCKLLLLLVVILIYATVVLSTPFLAQYAWVYFFSALGLIGAWLFPDWYFQGIEKMQYITYAALIARFAAVIAIFTLIHEPADFVYVAAIHSASLLSMAAIGLYIMLQQQPLQTWWSFRPTAVRQQFYNGFAYFLSNIAANSKEYFNIVLVGAVLNYQSVAIYDFAKKIMGILLVPTSTLARALFPLAARRHSLAFNFKVEKIMLTYSVMAMVLLWLLPDVLWQQFIHHELALFKQTLFILALTLPLYMVCGTRGFLTLVAFGHQRFFTQAILASVAVYFVSLLLLTASGYLQLYTAAAAIVLSLLVEAGLHHYYIQRMPTLPSTQTTP